MSAARLQAAPIDAALGRAVGRLPRALRAHALALAAADILSLHLAIRRMPSRSLIEGVISSFRMVGRREVARMPREFGLYELTELARGLDVALPLDLFRAARPALPRFPREVPAFAVSFASLAVPGLRTRISSFLGERTAELRRGLVLHMLLGEHERAMSLLRWLGVLPRTRSERKLDRAAYLWIAASCDGSAVHSVDAAIARRTVLL